MIQLPVRILSILTILLLTAPQFSFSQVNNSYDASRTATLLLSAKSSLNAGGYAMALRRAQTAKSNAMEGKDSQLEWEANNLIGEIYLTQKNYPKAIHIFLQMAMQAESIKNYSVSANAYLSLANIYATMGARSRAQEAYTTAFDQFNLIDFELGLVEVKAASSFNHLRSNNLDAALSDFNTLLTLAKKDSLIYFQLIALDGLLEVYQLKKDYQNGLKTGKEYLMLITLEGGSDQMSIRAYNQLALLYLNNDNTDKSFENLKNAEKLGSASSTNKRALANTYHIYSMAYEKTGSEKDQKKYNQKFNQLNKKLPFEMDLSEQEKREADLLAQELEKNSRAIISSQTLEDEKFQKSKRKELQEQEKSQLKSLEHEALIGNRTFGHTALDAEYTHQDLIVAQHEFESTERQAEILRYKEKLAYHALELKVAEEEKTILTQQTEIHNKQEQLYFIVGGGIFLIVIIFGVEFFRTKKLNHLLAKQQTIIHQRNVELEMSNATIMNKNAKLLRAHNEINEANVTLQNTQANLIQAEKMSALGLLTAGIAHEINNPISFVSNGLQVIEASFSEAFDTLEAYEELAKLDDIGQIQEKYAEIKSTLTDISLQKRDLDELMSDAKHGTVRIIEIVDGLRIFSRKDEQNFKKANIAEILDSALLITKSKYKGRVEIIKEYGEDVPKVDCFPGQLNQIFINLIGNASDAIDGPGLIKVVLQKISDNFVRIIIQDNGSGMSADTKNKIFEPLFTTKESGKGTGLGLSITMDLIKKHKGQIEVRSKQGIGTAFIITLKIDVPEQDPIVEPLLT
jgi:signal transduction histidine kinase